MCVCVCVCVCVRKGRQKCFEANDVNKCEQVCLLSAHQQPYAQM